jgi:hypothetical protein
MRIPTLRSLSLHTWQGWAMVERDEHANEMRGGNIGGGKTRDGMVFFSSSTPADTSAAVFISLTSRAGQFREW